MNNPRLPANVPDFVRSHAQRYLESHGKDGHLWDSTGFGDHGELPSLLLATVGRRTGKTVVTPLIYGEQDGAYVVVASNGGKPNHPHWYRNLAACPEVEIQVLAERFKARARVAVGTERAVLLNMMEAIYPTYKELANMTNREIPVVLLERE